MSQRWGLTERDSDKLRYLAVPPPAAAHCKGGTKQEGLPGKWDRCQKIHSKGISCSAWRIQGSFDVSSAGHKALTPRLFSEIKVGVFFRRQICRDPVTAPASSSTSTDGTRSAPLGFGFPHPGDRAKRNQVLVRDHSLPFLDAAVESGAALAGLCSCLFLILNKSS